MRSAGKTYGPDVVGYGWFLWRTVWSFVWERKGTPENAHHSSLEAKWRGWESFFCDEFGK